MPKKNVLVAGGAGFIGSHLCERLLKKYNVICLDNFSTGSEKNINHLVQNSDFEFIKHNISQEFDLEKMSELERFQINVKGLYAGFNFACPTSAKNFEKYKIDTLDANTSGMKNIMEMVLKYKSKFVHLSSSVVYGGREKNEGSVVEATEGIVDHLSPRACYDEGKRFVETMVATYHQVYKTDYKIARLFRVYGPRQRLFDGEMIIDFIVSAAQNQNLEIYGNESFKTSMIYVSDVVDALEKMLDAPTDLGPVNIGSDVDIKLADVAKKIIELTGSSSKIVYKKELPFITELALPSIKKIKDELGWLPLVRLEDGLKKTIDYTLAHKELLGI
ncbi:NAD-dependent epimerase/dehydratase family protein [Candidatus Parcubacteria bacterium]|nr:NAD-dependent epimerase/dehydratase family protein [Candidatus Parcubacteria bacterium]